MNLKRPSPIAVMLSKESREFADMLTMRSLAKRAQKLAQWRHMSGYSTNGLANALTPHPHKNTITNWEKGTKIPHEYLKQLVSLGFPEKHANYGI